MPLLCNMSTLAIVFRETNGWKWPVIQFIYMSTLAYLKFRCLSIIKLMKTLNHFYQPNQNHWNG